MMPMVVTRRHARFHLRWVTVAVALSACGASTSDPAPTPTGTTQVEPTTAERSELGPAHPHPSLSAAEHDEVCRSTGEPPSTDGCEVDEDCRICHDGSPCGVPASVTTMRARGAACAQPDAAECEPAAVRCCAGHCRVVSH